MTKAAGPRWVCEQCGVAFARQRSGGRPIRFCSSPCYQAWNRAHGSGGRFAPGLTPWNKDMKGLHLSPDSEWKKGQRGHNWTPVGTVTVRNDKNGTPRAYVKVAEPAKWRERAAVVWEQVNGPLPAGLVIHHKDRDSLNDTPDNLQAMTRAEHIAEHKADLLAAKRAA